MQGLDRYAYVNNNPLKYIDPSGHFPCVTCASIMLIANKLLALVGLGPDYQGVWIAEQHVTDKNAIVGAGIAVQSEYIGPWDTRDYAPHGGESGLGIAQIKDSEMGGLGLEGKDQQNPGVAVQAMAARLDQAVAACKKCSTDTDRFIVAALAQNGSGFGLTSIKNLPTSNGKIAWDQIMLKDGRNSSDPTANLRQSVSGMSYGTQLMLKLFTNDAKSLINKGFVLPDGFTNVNWSEIARLVNLRQYRPHPSYYSMQ